jgi:hypothetical protein
LSAILTSDHVGHGPVPISDLLNGQYSNPARVIAFNTAEGWSRDVTEEIANVRPSAYLRAPTDDQDANRARDQLKAFAANRGLSVSAAPHRRSRNAKALKPRALLNGVDARVPGFEPRSRISPEPSEIYRFA